MKVILTYEYEVTEADGVGTANDALVVAVRAVERDLKNANSTDDLGDVFTTIQIGTYRMK